MGRFEGQVFFVPYTTAGDHVLAEVTLLKKSHGEAKLIKIIQPSSHRVSPPCPVFGRCGGCRFQHVAYEEQLHQKDLYIKRALRGLKIGKIHSILPSPKPFHYRNRIQLHVRKNQLGFLKAKSDELVVIDGCPIAEEPIHHFLSAPGASEKVISKAAKKVELILDQSGQLNLRTVSESAVLAQFSQVNRFQNENLVRIIVTWARQAIEEMKKEPTQAVDLYAGSGNITFPLYEELGLPVTAIELSQTSVAMAATRARERFPGSIPVLFKAMSVDDYLTNLSSQSDLSSTLVVSDPPREGLAKNVIQKLTELKPPILIHVGCDLMNFARDLRHFLERNYEIEEVWPLDMFPQTDHVELIARLRLKGS